MNIEQINLFVVERNYFRRGFIALGKSINRAELIEALEKTKPGLSKTEVIEQATSFVFSDGLIITYNDEISVAHPLEELKGIEGAVKAEELYKLLTRMKDDELEIDIINNELRIITEHVKAGLVIEEIRLPLLDNVKHEKWHALPENFLDALKFVVFSCSRDMSKPVLTCVNITSNHVEASDGFRVTRQHLKTNLPIKRPFLIPESSVKQIINYDIENIVVEEEWAHFQTKDDTVLSCRIFNDVYPDIDAIGILEVEGIKLQLPNNLNEVIDRVAVFTQKQGLIGTEVLVSIADKKFKVRGQNEYGWVEEECRINYKKQPIRFSTNPEFLKDIVRLTQKCTVGKEKMKFVGDGWVHVLALSSNEEDIR